MKTYTKVFAGFDEAHAMIDALAEINGATAIVNPVADGYRLEVTTPDQVTGLPGFTLVDGDEEEAEPVEAAETVVEPVAAPAPVKTAGKNDEEGAL